MSDWIGWLEILKETAILVAVFTAIYEGARRLACHGFARWPAFMLAGALVVPIYEGSASLGVPGRVRELQAQELAQASLRGNEPPGGWEGAALSPEERTAHSTDAAIISYLLRGKRVQLIDAHGSRVPFNPTQEQLRNREQFVRDEKGAEDAAQQFYERGVRLYVSAALFAIVGLAVGWRQRRRG